jgi:hypothetical protein
VVIPIKEGSTELIDDIFKYWERLEFELYEVDAVTRETNRLNLESRAVASVTVKLDYRSV